MDDAKNELLAKLLAETAQIGWHELQRFYAQGLILRVASDVDLIEVAAAVANDDAQVIKQWQQQDQVRAPSKAEAKGWYNSNAQLWSVVVAPFVLVQDKDGLVS